MAPTEPEYVFTRDYHDNNRINLQHSHWVALFGYHTHPTIPLSGERLRIADVGTGTAAWLTDLADRLPSTVQLDGLDVSFHATPPPQWLPPNVTLRRWDVKEAVVPEDLVGAYDVVHIRNFAFVLRDDEVPAVVGRLASLLRPGGHLQWGEPDVASFRIETVSPDVGTEALARLLQLSQPQDARLSPRWVPRLPELFRAAGGLESVRADVRDAPPHLALAMHECNLTIHELVLRQTGNEDLARQVRDLMPLVQAETRQGGCWAFTRWTVVGRRKKAETS